MSGMNMITVIGNVGRDPEARNVGQNRVVTFPIAMSYGRGDKEKTIWFTAECWNEKRGEIAMDWVRKGHQVCIVGQLRPREYEDKEGKTRTDLTVDYSYDGTLTLLKNEKKDRVEGGTKSEDRQPDRGRGRPEPSRRSADLDDDIPF